MTALNLQQFVAAASVGDLHGPRGEWDILRVAATNTLYEALGGLVIGVTAGVLTAFAVSRWARVREAVLPIAIGASAIPIIAAAPIMSNWFGILNPFAKMAIVILLAFFPMLVNVARGLTQVDPSALELMQASAASRGRCFGRFDSPTRCRTSSPA